MSSPCSQVFFAPITNWPEKFFGDAIGETRDQAMERADREMTKAREGDAG